MGVNLKLQRAKIQRYIALEKAFETIDTYAIPSLSPKYFSNYKEIRNYLIENYSNDIDKKELKKYKF